MCQHVAVLVKLVHQQLALCMMTYMHFCVPKLQGEETAFCVKSCEHTNYAIIPNLIIDI
jgi:hypothetical protein